MYTATIHTVSIVSPGVTIEEEQIARETLNRWNVENGKEKGKVFLPLPSDSTAEPDIYVVTRRRNFLIALTNLITNGIIHNESRTKLIDISLGFSKERQVQLCVRDNGIGLDSEIYKKAIVPFGLHDSKFDHERLGLAVVNMFAKSVGGRLTHRMLRDGGTLMTLYMNEASSADFLLTRERRKYILDKNDYAYHLLTRVIDFD